VLFSKINSGAIVGLEVSLVLVEVNIDYQGFPGLSIVGLAGKEVDEAKERVRSAIKNSGYQFPARRITVNMSPADIPKKGSLYDLPIAAGILAASGIIRENLDEHFVIGELSLDGKINGVTGAIPMGLFAKNSYKYFCLPFENAEEVSVIKGLNIKAFKNLKDLVDFFNKNLYVPSYKTKSMEELIRRKNLESMLEEEVDFMNVKGQGPAKRALEIAAAGGHNVSLVGPPGAGKTLLARALPTILPDLTETEALEVTKIYSITGELGRNKIPFIISRPFRAPHHSASKAGILGGGTPISPGEISLAHHGILFLDEFPEFRREIIESLRQPIENREIVISRANSSMVFPSDFTLVIASNPCPCGNLGNPDKACSCLENAIKRYHEKLSGPMADRIDMHVYCYPVNLKYLSQEAGDERSSEIKKRVQKARDIQNIRYQNEENIFYNSDVPVALVSKYCVLNSEAQIFLTESSLKLKFSARSYHKVLKIARTIADLEGEVIILPKHISEAIQYRLSTL